MIDCGGVSCGASTPPVVRQTSGAPVLFSSVPNFDAEAYIDAHYDPDVAQILKNGVASTPVNAVSLSQLFAAGGTVTIHADSITGNGDVKSFGGPTIRVVNNSAAYLVLEGGAYIPDTPGAEVLFTGAAGRAQAGSLSLAEQSGTGPSIFIDNAYDGPSVGNSSFGPALFIEGNVTNLGGGVVVNNQTGSYGLTGNMNAQQVNITIPEGVVTISATGPGGLFNAGASPFAEWRSAMYWPGLNPATGVPDALEGAIQAINKIHGGNNIGELNQKLYSTAYSTTNRSYLYFGACGVPDMGDCSVGFARNQIPLSYFSPALPNTLIGPINWYNLSSQSDYPLVPFRHTPSSRSLTYASADTSGSAGSAQIFGAGQVAIKANVININGRIEAGQKTDWSVNLGAAAQSRIDYYRGQKQLKPWLSGVVDLGTQTTTTRSGDAKIGARYDIGRDRIILDDVNASSGGAHIFLDGKIINTSKLYGHIHVNGGLGDVEINNATSAKVVLGEIKTGSLDEGSAPVSRIKIVDRLKPSASNTTTFLYNPASGIKTYVTGNGRDPVLTGSGAHAPVFQSSGTSTGYDPKSGTRLEWTLRAILRRQVLSYRSNGNIQTIGNWAWDSGTATNPWEYRRASGSGQAYSYGYANDSNPQGILVNRPGGADFEQNLSASRGATRTALFRYHGCFVPFEVCNYGFRMTGLNDPSPHRNDPYGEWWYYMPLSLTLTARNSVKADNSFGIDFDGNAQGSVRVTSVAGIAVSKGIFNSTGNTTLSSSASNLVRWNNASVLTKSANLSAASNIGYSNRALKLTLSNDGNLTASGGSAGVHLDINSGVNLRTIQARTGSTYGNVTLKAAGDIKVGSGTGGVNIIGRNVTIGSANGAVGQGPSKPLVISAHGVALPDGAENGGVVSATALRDISIREQGSGDMRLQKAHSTTGNVTLHAASGSIIDIRDQTSSTGISDAQLAEVSQRLSLTTADGAQQSAITNSVTSLENSVNSSYPRYFRLIEDGAVTKGNFILNAGKIALYREIAKAALGLTGAPTDQQVRDFANTQYQTIAGTFESAFGANWAALAQFQTEDTSYTFTATAVQVANMTSNAAWLSGQLVSAIDASALQPASGVVGAASPLIVGRDVTLTAAGHIGSLAPSIEISLSDLQDGSLTTIQRSALAVATAPGSVLGTGTDTTNTKVSGFDILNVPNGVTLTGITVKQTAPTFVNASGTFRATAASDIFVQSTPGRQSAGATLTIGQITAGGDVSLAAPVSILGAVPGATAGIEPIQILGDGDLSLTAGSTDIGSALVPLTYRITGRLSSASAGRDVYLRTDDRDMVIGRVFGQRNVSLKADTGDLRSYLGGVAIAATNLDLAVSGNVGANGSPLQVQLGTTGSLTGAVGGHAYIYSPTFTGQTDVSLNVANFSALTASLTSDRSLSLRQAVTTGNLTAAAGTNLVFQNVSAGGSIIATAIENLSSENVVAGTLVDFNAGQTVSITGNNRSVMAATSVQISGAALQMTGASGIFAGGTINVATTGDAVIGSLETTMTAANPVAGITVAGDRILSADPSSVNVATSTPHVQTQLTANRGIGLPSAALQVRNPTIIASTTSGGIYINGFGGADLIAETLTAGGDIRATSAGMVTVTTARSTGGGVDLQAGNALAVSTANAGTTFAATSTGSTITVGSATSGGDQTLNAHSGIGFGTLVSTGGSISTTTANGDTVGTRVTAGRNVSLQSVTGGVAITNLQSGGNASVVGAGMVTLPNVNAGKTFAATSTGSTITIGSATSGGDQTLNAYSGIGFGTLVSTGSPISTTTTNGDTIGTRVTAGRSVSVQSVTGGAAITNLQSGGNASVVGAGKVTLPNVSAGTTFAATSTGNSIEIGTAKSNGQQALSAKTGIIFDTVESTISGIFAVTELGGIVGKVVVAKTLVAFNAILSQIGINSVKVTQGAATFNAKEAVTIDVGEFGMDGVFVSKDSSVIVDQINSGRTITAMAGQNIQFNSLNAGLDVVGRSTLDILGGRVTAGRHVDLRGRNIRLDDATAGSDLTLDAKQDITARSLTAGSRLIANAEQGSFTAQQIKAAALSFTAGGTLKLNLVDVRDAITLNASEIIATIRQSSDAPAGQALRLSIAGSQVPEARSATLTIDAPNGVVVERYAVTDSTITTTARRFAILDGLVSGTLSLRSPTLSVWLNNRGNGGQPIAAANIQLFEPSRSFAFALNANAMVTSTYVVNYGPGVSVSMDTHNGTHSRGAHYEGASMVRDFLRQMRNGDGAAHSNIKEIISLFFTQPAADDSENPGALVFKEVAGPAVNTGY